MKQLLLSSIQMTFIFLEVDVLKLLMATENYVKMINKLLTEDEKSDPYLFYC